MGQEPQRAGHSASPAQARAEIRGPDPMTPGVPVAFRRLDPELPAPAYAHEGDAGADLYAAVDVELKPGERSLVPTGLAIALPVGYVGLVHPRSGLAAKLGVTVLNAPGTVDAGYRGEILVNLINHDPRQSALIRRGDRIAQLVVQRVERADFDEVTELPTSARGAGGHGSTGGITALRGAAGAGPALSGGEGELTPLAEGVVRQDSPGPPPQRGGGDGPRRTRRGASEERSGGEW